MDDKDIDSYASIDLSGVRRRIRESNDQKNGGA